MKILLIAFLTLSACTTSHEVKELDDEPLAGKGKTLDGEVGINSNNQAVIRKKSSAADELRIQDAVNMRLRDELDSDLFALKSCRQQRADKRLGGDGRVAKIPDIDDMTADYQVREQLGLDSEGNLSVVREQLFEERLTAERKYETTLRTMTKTVKLHLDECTMALAESRRSAGLPSEATKAEGYFTKSGDWVETKRGAQTLDDEFEIQAERTRLNRENVVGH